MLLLIVTRGGNASCCLHEEQNNLLGETKMEKRELKQSEKKGISLQDLLLTAVLLAAGAVLKFFVGTYITCLE